MRSRVRELRVRMVVAERGIARNRRTWWTGQSPSAAALGWRAAASGAGPRARARSRGVVSRRADREPRPGRDQGHRGCDPGSRGSIKVVMATHDLGGARQASRRDRADSSRPRIGKHSGRRVFRAPEIRRGAPVHCRRSAGLASFHP